jgi:hypothetical protein
LIGSQHKISSLANQCSCNIPKAFISFTWFKSQRRLGDLMVVNVHAQERDMSSIQPTVSLIIGPTLMEWRYLSWYVLGGGCSRGKRKGP